MAVTCASPSSSVPESGRCFGPHPARAGRLGYRVVGCVDDVQPTDVGLMPWLGTVDGLSKVLSNTVIDELFVALPMRSGYGKDPADSSGLRTAGCSGHAADRFFCVATGATNSRWWGARPLACTAFCSGPRASPAASLSVKRYGRLRAGRRSGVVALSPLLLAVAAAVELTSPGPVIFSQVRMGLNKRLFRLCKFRTMVADAGARRPLWRGSNEAGGPLFKLRHDPRLTPSGATCDAPASTSCPSSSTCSRAT